MPIDWFTVAAQAVNFLILVGLLKHFLYGPIVGAMDEREKRIAGRLQEAEQKRAQADEEREELAAERSKLEERRREKLRDAEQEAEKRRKQLLEDAREEARQQEARWRAELDRRSEQLTEELLERLERQLLRALEKALADLANAELHDAAVGVFVERLARLDEDDREELREVLGSEAVKVRTAHELSDGQRERLTGVIGELGLDRDGLELETDPSLIAGIELHAGGRRLSWSLSGYTRDLGTAFREALRSSEPERTGERQQAGDRDRSGEGPGDDEAEPEHAASGGSKGEDRDGG